MVVVFDPMRNLYLGRHILYTCVDTEVFSLPNGKMGITVTNMAHTKAYVRAVVDTSDFIFIVRQY